MIINRSYSALQANGGPGTHPRARVEVVAPHDDEADDDEMDEAGNRIEAARAKYCYGEVDGEQVGKDWLKSGAKGRNTSKKAGNPADEEEAEANYRRKLYAALHQARDRYRERLKDNEPVPKSLLTSPPLANAKTCEPPIPDFSKTQRAIQGSPNTFTIDHKHINIYKPDNTVKATYDVDEAKVLKLTSSVDNGLHQVQILLDAQSKETLIFESTSLHECKVLSSSISYANNSELADGIAMAQQIEKASRLASILSVMVYSMAKRNVQMYQFREMTRDYVRIANAARNLRKTFSLSWFKSILTAMHTKEGVQSSFRAAAPRWVDHRGNPLLFRLELSESKVQKSLERLQTFIANRRINRSGQVSAEIRRKFAEEDKGIALVELQLETYDKARKRGGKKYKKAMSITNKLGSLAFGSDEGYKFMVIENMSSGTEGTKVQDLVHKLDVADVSFMSTDLDPNETSQQSEFNIKMYGLIVKEGRSSQEQREIVPSMIGLDVLRKARPRYKISVSLLEFPLPGLVGGDVDLTPARQELQKITVYIKLFQFVNPEGEQKGKAGRDKQGTTTAILEKELKPHFFEMTSGCIKLKGHATGVLSAEEPSNNLKSATFYIDQLSTDPDERFAIGLAVRMADSPVQQVAERLLHHEVLNSFDQDQLFSYKDIDFDQLAVLHDFQENPWRITFQVQKVEEKSAPSTRVSEPEGKRLLIGRYVLHKGTPACVKSLSVNKQVQIIDMLSRNETTVPVSELTLIESSGVNVFDLNSEPEFVQSSTYAWILNMRVHDKTLVNRISSKIQIHQTHLALYAQDKVEPEAVSGIQGDIIISLTEARGLILPSEVDRRQQNLQLNKLDPVVVVQLEKLSGEIIASGRTEPLQNKREVIWDTTGETPGSRSEQAATGSGNTQKPFTVNLGKVSHSGKIGDGDEIYDAAENKEMHYVHIIVKNDIDGQELGAQKIEIDELIDPKLKDLAKEYCVGLNRQRVLDAIGDARIKAGVDRELVQAEMLDYALYSGIIRFQTLFQPTSDTRLRYQKTQDTSQFHTPKQLLHLEHLLAKNDFDLYKFSIPKVEYNPNLHRLGEQEVNLPELQQQLRRIPALSKLTEKLKNGEELKLTENLLQQLDEKVIFQSPFEQLYILLKLQRGQRPLTEEVLFQFKIRWELYRQSIRYQAFESMNLNEWFSYIDSLQRTAQGDAGGKLKASKPTLQHVVTEQLERQSSASNQSEFWSGMVRRMTNKADEYKRLSEAKPLFSAGQNMRTSHNLGLMQSQEWEKERNQQFHDLVALVKCGIPVVLRTVVWSNFMKTAQIQAEEKKEMMQHFAEIYDKELTISQNFEIISLKYDSIAFRQVDQDISDFKFPVGYFEEAFDQNLLSKNIFNNMAQNQANNINRINKLKHDKQLMRKLLRMLLIWGKKLNINGTKYQFCYTTGFLKVAHRFINLMSIEDAFWTLVGFIKQNPRLWCLQESSLLDQAKSNFRFEFIILKSILEVNFPKVTAKLYQLGLPVEVLVYDSITSLYSDFFHSDILLRIWDLMIFHHSLSDPSKRGIWFVLAPALLIISLKQDAIIEARTAQEATRAYKDGCGLDYNPNRVIGLINKIVDDIFLKQPGLKTSTYADPIKIDEMRRQIQKASELIYQKQRASSKIVRDLLITKVKSAAPPVTKKEDLDALRGDGAGNLAAQDDAKGPAAVGKSMEFAAEDDLADQEDLIEGEFAEDAVEAASHRVLDYSRWRQGILPAVQNKLLMNQEIVGQDLNDRDDGGIYTREAIDAKYLFLYLHGIESLDHLQPGKGPIQDIHVKVQYGRKQNGQIEVKQLSNLDNSNADTNEHRFTGRSGSLNFFCNFKYQRGHNHIHIEVLQGQTEEKLCHFTLDLRGHQRGRFILLQKLMVAQRVTTDIRNTGPLPLLKLSLFLEPGKSNQIDLSVDEEETKNIFLNSLKKFQPGVINILKAPAERDFQRAFIDSLQHIISHDYKNLLLLFEKEDIFNILHKQYKYTEVQPRSKFGHLLFPHFQRFMKACLPDHEGSITANELADMYHQFSQSAHHADFTSKCAIIKSIEATEDMDHRDHDYVLSFRPAVGNFSLRAFIQLILFLSPLTVKEKLDILYDLADMCNPNEEGIDINSAQMIYHAVLQSHLYYLPTNEILTMTEHTFYPGGLDEVVGVYWTDLDSKEIAFDMPKEKLAKLEDVLQASSWTRMGISGQGRAIDITKQFQETFIMYQNLFGNKMLDFNVDTSPFRNIDCLFTARLDEDVKRKKLGTSLLNKTRTYSSAALFRLCILTRLCGGEHKLDEIWYDHRSGKLRSDQSTSSAADDNLFKRLFTRNSKILNLAGNQRPIEKQAFLEKSKKIPFVYDLMRAETLWQDRRAQGDDTSERTVAGVIYGNKDPSRDGPIASLKPKRPLTATVNIYLSDREKTFIFKFEPQKPNSDPRAPKNQIQELVKGKVYLFEMDALHHEDIVLDIRDRIANELTRIQRRRVKLRPALINEVAGEMQFCVRHLHKVGDLHAPDADGWVWKDAADFDRVERFTTDSCSRVEDYQGAGKGQIVFKLSKLLGQREDQVMDDQPSRILEGYDCFGLYHHLDGSVEWRPAKIVKKEALHPNDSTMDQNQRLAKHGSTRFKYLVEFEHLKIMVRPLGLPEAAKQSSSAPDMPETRRTLTQTAVPSCWTCTASPEPANFETS